MKKLMIAAAAAAMIGGAQADLAYNYSASLKTTVGKGGGSTTITVNLGMDDNGTFWYLDTAVGSDDGTGNNFENGAAGVYRIQAQTVGNVTTYHKIAWIGGADRGVIDITGLKTTKGLFADLDYDGDGVADFEAIVTCTEQKYGAFIGKMSSNANFKLLNDTQKALVATAFGNTYDNKSAGKWCDTFKYKSVVDCYRAAGSAKQSAIVKVTDCCTDQYVDDDNNYTISFDLFNRFGGITIAKAMKIEVCGYVNGYCDGATADQFSLAGQGTWSDKLAKDSDKEYVKGVSSISGNIVGVLAAPDCEYCCQASVAARAFECDETINAELPTAAYGTWSLKFNKSKSDL